MSILEVKNLKKVYTTRFSNQQVQALSNVSFSVEEGEYVAIMGESGSGKTTLLNILASLDKPTSGEVLLNGKDMREQQLLWLHIVPKQQVMQKEFYLLEMDKFFIKSIEEIKPTNKCIKVFQIH